MAKKTAQEKNTEYNAVVAEGEERAEKMQARANAARITNVKYKQGQVTIVYSLVENNADNKIVLSSTDEPCAAFIDALNALAPHVANMIFHAGGEKTYQANCLDVKGVHFDWKGDELLAGITATLNLDSGKTTTLNTPPLPLTHPEPNVVKHTKEAADAIENVLKETRRFLAGARAQGNLFARKTA